MNVVASSLVRWPVVVALGLIPLLARAEVTVTEVAVDCLNPGVGNFVVDTPVYRVCLGQGFVRRVFIKGSSSPLRDLGELELALVYDGLVAGLAGLAYDTTATSSVEARNATVFRYRITGQLQSALSSMSSYGSATTVVTCYRERFVIDVEETLRDGGVFSPNDELFLATPNWFAGTIRADYRYCSGSCGFFATATATPTWTTRLTDRPLPITAQTLFELGAMDGLVSSTALDRLGSLVVADLWDGRPMPGDAGSPPYMYVEISTDSAPRGALIGFTNVNAVTATDGGFDEALSKAYHDDLSYPGSLEFSTGDGVARGFARERGAYLLDDGDDDEHVEFVLDARAPRVAPVFEISGWNAAAPTRILVAGVEKQVGLELSAAVEGDTLFVQYFDTVRADSTFEIGLSPEIGLPPPPAALRVLKVGCSCTAAPPSVVAVALLALVSRRHRRRACCCRAGP